MRERAPLVRFVLLVLCTSIINCRYSQSDKTSWSDLKDDFATKNLKTFEITDELEKSFRRFKSIENPVTTAVNTRKVYLYSWEGNHLGMSRFTLLADGGEHGISMIYCIFNNNDELLSYNWLASKGGEGGILYETRSKYIAADTLLKIEAATTSWDFSKADSGIPVKLKRPMGDSTFYHVTLLAKGKFVENKISEKKELNLTDPNQ